MIQYLDDSHYIDVHTRALFVDILGKFDTIYYAEDYIIYNLILQNLSGGILTNMSLLNFSFIYFE